MIITRNMLNNAISENKALFHNGDIITNEVFQDLILAPKNMSSFIQDYNGKYLVISENLEVEVFDTIADAYRFGAKAYGLGKFLLQECTTTLIKYK